MTKKHKAASKKNRFCCVRGKPCKCESPHNYRTICDPGWRDAKGKPTYEAHHALCVSSVNSCVVKKKGMAPVRRQTRWCVNSATNMIALPLWGHTVKWYFKNDTSPPFRNRPQHDWDHNGSGSYREEVEESLDAMMEDLADAKDKHDDERIKNLKAGLDSRSRRFKNTLRTRGRRNGGTHKQFTTKGARPRWHEPFSMAGSATEKGYPAQNWRDLVREKVKSYFG